MTLARSKHSSQERSIAKALGLTDAQLDAPLRIKAGYWPGNAAACLEQKGLAYQETAERPHHLATVSPYYAGKTETRLTGKRALTDAGLALLERAGAMGFWRCCSRRSRISK